MGILYKRNIRNNLNTFRGIFFGIKEIIILVIIIKEIGSIRKLDELGRIVIPKSVRDVLNMEQGDNIEFFIEDNKVLLKKSNALDKNENEIYKLLQLYYLKYYKSSVILESGRVILEYGKDVDKIKEFIDNKNLNAMNKKVAMKISYLNKYFYVTNIKDKYHFIVYEDKMFTSLDSEILNFVIDYINKLV